MKCEIVLSGHGWPDDLVGRTVQSMRDEHQGYYGKPCGARPLDRSDPRGPWCGYTAGELFHEWHTSGNNYLGIRRAPDGTIHVLVSGARHGIPWRFIPAEARNRMDRLVHIDEDMHPAGEGHQFVEFRGYETREPELAPWETRSDHPTQWGV